MESSPNTESVLVPQSQTMILKNESERKVKVYERELGENRQSWADADPSIIYSEEEGSQTSFTITGCPSHNLISVADEIMYAVDSTLMEWDDQKVLAELAQLKRDAGIRNATVSLDFEDVKDITYCALCRQVANNKCQSCLSVAYCSREHQKEHWKAHRPYCVLHEVVEDSVNGSYLVAKHNIKKGEAIFTEDPYFVTPFPQDENFELLKFQPLSSENKDLRPLGKYTIEEYVANNLVLNVCLGCSMCLPSNYAPCVDCGWPTCGTCSQLYLHKQHECGYFKSKNIEYEECRRIAVIMPKFVGLIRALLLRRQDPKRWGILYDDTNNKVWTDRSNQDLKLRINAEYFYVTLRQVFKFEDVTYSELGDVLRILELMTYYGCMFNNQREKIREYCGVYRHASVIRHRCVANVVCFQTHPTSMHVIAATAIKKGDVLWRTVNFGPQILPETQRQRVSMILTNKLCECLYCTDPTKREDNLSAILCLKCKRRGLENYMIPVDTMDIDTPWKCGKCGAIKTNAQAQKLFNDANRDFQQCNDGSGNPYILEGNLRQLLYKYKCNSPLHCGHWLILSTENDVICLMIQRLQHLSLEETDHLLQLITARINILGKFVPDIHSSLVGLKMRLAQSILHRWTRLLLRGQGDADVMKVLKELQQIYDDIAKSFVEQTKKNVLQSYLLLSLRNLRRIIDEVGNCYNRQQRQARIKRALKLPSLKYTIQNETT
ncbi:Protein msta, isoform B [Orchesella cincta]|uniref:Protein msta, isoform B n=1 Tax=Orchesella cincta TaxID=48709 RepID=A0A1D2NM35_ORCCI|nr:Protein msta, isoform B [Orchesella cincta]